MLSDKFSLLPTIGRDIGQKYIGDRYKKLNQPSEAIMNKKHSALLASLTAIVILGGCASKEPVSTLSASSSQAGTVPQSATGSAATSPASSTSAVQTSGTLAKPVAGSVYFEYDSFAVGNQYASLVRTNADYFGKTNDPLQLDGNADERGSREYNMALGQKRADAVKRAMTVLGAKSDRIDTVSYGEDKPKATGRDEAAWAENRRVDFVPKSK